MLDSTSTASSVASATTVPNNGSLTSPGDNLLYTSIDCPSANNTVVVVMISDQKSDFLVLCDTDTSSNDTAVVSGRVSSAAECVAECARANDYYQTLFCQAATFDETVEVGDNCVLKGGLTNIFTALDKTSFVLLVGAYDATLSTETSAKRKRQLDGSADSNVTSTLTESVTSDAVTQATTSFGPNATTEATVVATGDDITAVYTTTFANGSSTSTSSYSWTSTYTAATTTTRTETYTYTIIETVTVTRNSTNVTYSGGSEGAEGSSGGGGGFSGEAGSSYSTASSSSTAMAESSSSASDSMMSTVAATSDVTGDSMPTDTRSGSQVSPSTEATTTSDVSSVTGDLSSTSFVTDPPATSTTTSAEVTPAPSYGPIVITFASTSTYSSGTPGTFTYNETVISYESTIFPTHTSNTNISSR